LSLPIAAAFSVDFVGFALEIPLYFAGFFFENLYVWDG